MPVGQSGRLVIEIDPDLKKDFYAVLERDGLTLREWFLQRAHLYIQNGSQLRLFAENPDGATR